MAKLEEVIQRGTRAGQPAATAVPVGTLYFVTDELIIERSTGAAWQSYSGGGGGSVATDAIWDAKGDIAAGTGANAAARVAVGADDTVLRAAAAEATGTKFDSPAVFKQTILNGNGNKTTTSTTFVAIDATNLAYLTLPLAIGDVVRCTLVGQTYHTTEGHVQAFDFEVDRPTSGDTRIGAGADNGLAVSGHSTRTPVCVVGHFVATEAGVHGFRPMWLQLSGSTATLANAASGNDDSTILFSVEKLGAPRA